MKKLVLGFELCCLVMVVVSVSSAWGEEKEKPLFQPSRLEKFVDQVPVMPRIKGFDLVNGAPVPKLLHLSMFRKKWKFHRDLPPTPVFAYGTSMNTATVPGPTVEALQGIDTCIRWNNQLGRASHIFPWDRTIPTAQPRSGKGIPTVVHLHGGIDEPASDGHATSWFTSNFEERGPSWTKETYHYNNYQHPGTLWYHDHAMGLTRLNILAGLMGAYIIRQPSVESPLGLPYGDEFDRPLLVFDRHFVQNGSIYMNPKGNTKEHQHWQPEYFGNVIVVNGKAWPKMNVRRRKYRFRIINASNSRFFNFYFGNGSALLFVHVGSDSAYNEQPVAISQILIAPSEIADVVVDFSESASDSVVLYNNAPYPYPKPDKDSENNTAVMKFIIKPAQWGRENDTSRIPTKLIKYVSPDPSTASITRYISLHEYTVKVNGEDEPTHLFINGKPFEAPVTETPKVGTTEIWNVINLTEDNHPLHIHLGFMSVLEQRMLVDSNNSFTTCMNRTYHAVGCQLNKYAIGERIPVPAHEKGWKNVFKMRPGCVTKVVVRFSYIHTNVPYPFDATAHPGYVYHCHDKMGHHHNSHHHQHTTATDGGDGVSQRVNSPRFSGPMTRRAQSFKRNNKQTNSCSNNVSSQNAHNINSNHEIIDLQLNSPRSETPVSGDAPYHFRPAHVSSVAQMAPLRRKMSSLSVDLGDFGFELKGRKKLGQWMFLMFCGVCLFLGVFKICATGWFGSAIERLGTNQMLDHEDNVMMRPLKMIL